jgi:hypothetical protein
MIVSSQVCCCAAFIVLAKYVASRGTVQSPALIDLTLLTVGLWPSTFYFRMAYTESLFLLCSVLSMYAMLQRWPTLWIALLVGLTTAMRPVGMALAPVFAWYLWEQAGVGRQASAPSQDPSLTAQPPVRLSARLGRFLQSAGWGVPLAFWGLGGYMLFLWWHFHDPFAFIEAQKYWVARPTPWSEKLLPLLTLQPLWSPFVPSSPEHWSNVRYAGNPLLNYAIVNPLVFIMTGALIALGGIKRWLAAREVLLSVLLLALAYFGIAYDNMMLGQARFASVVFPAYFVIARLLLRGSIWVRVIFFLCSAALLIMYTALFTGGYGQTHLVLY